MYVYKFIILIIITINYRLIKVTTFEASNQCECSCAFISATSGTTEYRCPYVGLTSIEVPTIIWKDGSYSDTSLQFSTILAVGSCCAHINVVEFGKGSITGGVYVGQPATLVISYQDSKPGCVSCLTKSRIGVSHFSGLSFLEIGSPHKPIMRCKGTIDMYQSPALTPAVQLVTYTYELEFTECTNCTDCIVK